MSDWKNVQYKDGKMRTSSGGGGGGASALTDLDDVAIPSPSIGQGLIYNDQTGKWENANLPSGGVTKLADLDDVDLSSLANGQILKWDAVAQKFINSTFKDNDAIFSPSEKNSGARLCSFTLGSTGNEVKEFLFGTFPDWSDVVGFLFSRTFIYYMRFSKGGSTDSLVVNTWSTLISTSTASYRIDTSTNKLYMTIYNYNTYCFFGFVNGVKIKE